MMKRILTLVVIIAMALFTAPQSAGAQDGEAELDAIGTRAPARTKRRRRRPKAKPASKRAAPASEMEDAERAEDSDDTDTAFGPEDESSKVAGDGAAGGGDGLAEGGGDESGDGSGDAPPAPAAAQSDDTDDDALESAPLTLRRSRDRSSDSAIRTPGSGPSPDAEEFDLNVFGYMRLLGSAVQSDPEVAFVGRNDGYRLLNARVGIEGRIGERYYMRISADGANDERSNPNEVEGTLRFGLKDAFADIRLSPALEVRVGRFPVIFDIETFVSSIERGFIRRSIESRGVSPTEGFEQAGLGVARNLGLAFRAPKAFDTGSFSIGYEVAAQNGNGEFDASNDNDALAYSGTLIGSWRDSLLVFGSFRYNERTEGELPFRRTETDYETAFGAWLELKQVRFAGQLIFRRTTFGTTGAADESGYGGHAEILFRVPGLSGLRAGYRYAILDASDRIPQNGVQEHTVGASYELPDSRMGVKANLTLPIEDEGRELDNSRAELLFEVQL